MTLGEKTAEKNLCFPEHLQAQLRDMVLDAPGMFIVVLDDACRIEFANRLFCREVCDCPSSTDFLSTLTDECSRDVRRALTDAQSASVNLSLHHSLPAGPRMVSYTFRRVGGDTWIALGHDESVRSELLEQLCALVDDLEAKIEREQGLVAELQALVKRDPLTLLPNRRFLNEVLSELDAPADDPPSARSFAVLCIDIDRFKTVNDRYGHLFGDQVLQTVASVLRCNLRDTDQIARYGGEEFVVLAEDAAQECAYDFAERLRLAVEKACMPEPLERITVSVGLAYHKPESRLGVTEVLDLADQALYLAKRDGRNCVRVASVVPS